MRFTPETFSETKRHLKLGRGIGLTLAAIVALLTLRTLATADDQPSSSPDSDASSLSTPDGFEKIVLETGNAQKLSLGHKIKRANILIPDIADVVPLGPDDLLITAKKAGMTQLIIWDEADHTEIINIVVASDIEKLRKQLKTLFPDCTITVDETGGSLTLHGQVPSLQDAVEATQVASNYGKVLNLMEVSGGEQIMLKVKIAEVSKQAEQELGFNFAGQDGISAFVSNAGPDLFAAQASATGSSQVGLLIPAAPTSLIWGGGTFGDVAFAYFIHALETNNIIRLLAEPNLVTTSGEEAHFMAGGQFPYPVPQSGTSGGGTTITIQFQPYGVDLKFIPIVLGNGRIRLKVEPNVSELDYSHAVTVAGTSVPGLTQREVETTVEMGEGQTMALAGLLQDNISGANAQFPILGDLPILGPLFRSVQYQRNETELVILVTPVLVHAMNPGDVTAAPGEHWRNPTNPELYLYKDLGGEDISNPPAVADTTVGYAEGLTRQPNFNPAAATASASQTPTATAAATPAAIPAAISAATPASARAAAPTIAPTQSVAPAAPSNTPASVNVTEPTERKTAPTPAAPANPPPLFQGTYGFSPANSNSQQTAGASDSLK